MLFRLVRALVPVTLLVAGSTLSACSPGVGSDPAPSPGGVAGNGGAATGGAATTGGSAGETTGGVGGSGGSAGGGALGGSGGSTAGNGGAGLGGGAGGGSAGAPGGSGGSAGASAGSGAGLSGTAGSSTGGGGGGDSGSAGSAGSDVGSGGAAGGAAGPCTAPGLTFCSDFEGLTTGAAPSGMGLGTHLNGNGTVVVDAATPAHSGTKSIKVNATGYQTFFKLTGTPVFPAMNGKLFVRVYVRLGAAMTGGHNTYFEAGLDAASDAPYETRVGVMNEMLMINQPNGDRGFLSNENYYVDHLPGTVIPATTWTCVESFFDTPASTVSFWVEGVDVPDLHRTDWQQEAYDALRFGYEKYAGPDAELWYDDLAVGNERIGCFP
jgi:hypothetical protein